MSKVVSFHFWLNLKPSVWDLKNYFCLVQRMFGFVYFQLLNMVYKTCMVVLYILKDISLNTR